MAELQDIRERLARARAEQQRSAEALCGAVERATSSLPPPPPPSSDERPTIGILSALPLLPIG